MASPQNQRCASCIGTLSFAIGDASSLLKVTQYEKMRSMISAIACFKYVIFILHSPVILPQHKET